MKILMKIPVKILTYIGSALIGALIFFMGILFAPHPAPVVSLGATNPGATPLFDTVLTQQLGTSDTTMYLKSVTDNQGNVLSGYQCFTVDVNSPTVEYLCGTISGTTVIALTRNLSYQTATTTYATPTNIHRVGADVRITDFPALGILENQLNGKDTIGTLLQYANTVLIGSLTSSTTLATKYYVDQTAVSGAPNASPTVKGIVQFATALQAASSTATGSTGALLALGNGIATDTPSVPQSVSGSKVIMSTMGGYLNQAWLNLSNAFTWTGNHIFNGTLTANATTTIAASSLTNNALILNGLSYQFPAFRAASSTVLSENGSGLLSFEQLSSVNLGYISAPVTNGTTTIAIPAGDLTSFQNRVKIDVGFEVISGTNEYCLAFGDGTATTTVSCGSNTNVGPFALTIAPITSSSQRVYGIKAFSTIAGVDTTTSYNSANKLYVAAGSVGGAGQMDFFKVTLTNQ